MLMTSLRRLSALPSAPELAEVLTNAIVIGWAWALLWPGTFGPPGTTVHHIVRVFGAAPSAGWAFVTAILPVISLATGDLRIRLISTLLCGFTWSIMAVVSVEGGVWMSPSMATAAACLAALFVSQCGIVSGLRDRWPPYWA